MELNRFLLVFTLCLISRTLALESKKLYQPHRKDILTLESEEPVHVDSETRVRQADEEEGGYGMYMLSLIKKGDSFYLLCHEKGVVIILHKFSV
jgi:hypothetical protein